MIGGCSTKGSVRRIGGGEFTFHAFEVSCGRRPQIMKAGEGKARKETSVRRTTEMEAMAATGICGQLQLGL